MNWNLTGGVLIIGSLLWQDYLYDKGDDIRLNWRNAHLDFNNKIPVKVPIRYGRIPESEIATMVFSNRMKNRKGFGFVVPFKKKINNQDELLWEALALSAAEGMKGNFVCTWGVLAYLLNTGTIPDNLKKEIISLFRKRKNIQFNIEDYKVTGERSCLTRSLKLDIDWIEAVIPEDKEKLNNFHFLLATATMPKKPISTKEEIAETIKTDNKRRYFINNLTSGIITSEDFEISNLI
jgi:hypothetical protein